MATSERTKLIVGIDYGTTFSGIAFALQSASDFKDIIPYTAWPGGPRENNDHLVKAPSQIAYAIENEGLDRNVWGYEVEAGMTTYSWTKLLLDKKALQIHSDDPGLRSAIQSGMLRVPRGKSAVDVVSDYLGGIHKMFWAIIGEKLGGYDILDVTPIEFWLTVPAIWSDEAKSATKQAALRAGFGSRPGDEVNLIPEPEAATHVALKSSIAKTDDLVRPNTGVLVCDCGGGTVDITSYTIEAAEPRLVIRESGIGTGGKCGATYIDRNLHALLTKRFGRAFTSLGPERTGPGSRFMNQFESKKKDFSLSNARKTVKLQLKMPQLENTKGKIAGYDKDYDEVILSENDIQMCFDPVLEKIIGLLSAQVAAVGASREPPVRTIILVGGLGASPYIGEGIQAWCSQRQIRMVTPWSGAWSAVVCGAVLRGLEGSLIREHKARRNYGLEMSRRFKAGEDLESGERWDKRYTHAYTGEVMLSQHVMWLVKKGDTFDDKTEIEMKYNAYHREGCAMTDTCHLWSCALDDAPDWAGHERVQKVGKEIMCSFNGIDLTQLEHRMSSGDRVYLIPITIRIKLGAKSGELEMRTVHKGVQVGMATIDFSHT